MLSTLLESRSGRPTYMLDRWLLCVLSLNRVSVKLLILGLLSLNQDSVHNPVSVKLLIQVRLLSLNQDKVHHRVSVKLLILVWLLSLNQDKVHHRVSVKLFILDGYSLWINIKYNKLLQAVFILNRHDIGPLIYNDCLDNKAVMFAVWMLFVFTFFC